jgi:hypothetical protein
MSAAVEELQEQLLNWEEQLNNTEGIIVAWEDGLMASERTHGRACMEHDTKHTKIEGVRQDCLTKSPIMTSSSKHSLNFNRMSEEC